MLDLQFYLCYNEGVNCQIICITNFGRDCICYTERGFSNEFIYSKKEVVGLYVLCFFIGQCSVRL